MKELLFDDIAAKKAPSKRKVADKLSPLQLKDFYCDQGKSLDDIGKMFGCSKVYVLQLMREYNIPTRNRSEASAQAKRLDKVVRFTEVDEKFFSERTPQMAYVLGCIYSHGYASAYCPDLLTLACNK